ncbi:MAG: HAD family hydrolase [Alphaproteobacteria bacterium]
MSQLKKFGSKPSLIIFDCDGVLVDSEPIANRILVEALGGAGYPITLDDAVARFVGRSMAAVVEMVEADLGRPLPDGFVAALQARTFAAFERDLTAMPGVAEVLAELDVAVCVASSGSPDKIAHSLSLTGLDRFFDGNLFSAAMVARGKPAPDLFLYAAKEMKVDPGCCLVIEDSVPGVEAARAAGMVVLGFVGGGHADAALGGRLRLAGATVFSDMADLDRMIAEA